MYNRPEWRQGRNGWELRRGGWQRGDHRGGYDGRRDHHRGDGRRGYDHRDNDRYHR
jgi:hypothetical protein